MEASILHESVMHEIAKVVGAFRSAALSKVDYADAVLTDEGYQLTIGLEEIAATVDAARGEVFRYGAELARATFCAGWLWSRAYTKPRGYAGDYLLLHRMYQPQPTGDQLGDLLDRTFLEAPSAQAVLNRRTILADAIEKYTRGASALRVLSLGSGPGQELVDVSRRLGKTWDGTHLTAVCVDIDLRALNHLRMALLGSRVFVPQPLRRDVRHLTADSLGPIGFAYAAGVFDYLTDEESIRLLNMIWETLEDGGSALIGNFRDRRPPQDEFSMDYVMEWRLRYRDESTLAELVAKTKFGRLERLFYEPSGINGFAVMRK